MPRPRSYTVILTLAFSVTALAGCGFVEAGNKSSVKPSSFVISGNADVALPSGTGTPGAACTAPVGASDVAKDAAVTVTTPTGFKIAAGRLGGGVVTGDGAACSFPFQIRAVTGGYDTYGVSIGNRPAQSFDAVGLRANQPAVLTITPAPATP